MLSLIRERMSAPFVARVSDPWSVRRGAGRHWSASFAASAAVHVGLCLVLGWLWLAAPRESARLAALDSRWQPDDRPEPLVEIERPLANVVIEQTDGGREAAALVTATAELDASAIFPALAAREAADHTAEQILRDGLALEVGAASSGSGTAEGGSGTGAGNGTGDGRGRFFGAAGQGRRFVYVVDRSASMNQHHASEWNTRFRRLKFELLTSIGHMTPEMEFYIVFFNHHAQPMPAAGLQSATTRAKREYLEWMARIRAAGETDPRAALDTALRLRPDTIYFLSDGAFPDHVAADLKSIRQQTVVIHTFALGDTAGRQILESVAAQNGGKFHFVP